MLINELHHPGRRQLGSLSEGNFTLFLVHYKDDSPMLLDEGWHFVVPKANGCEGEDGRVGYHVVLPRRTLPAPPTLSTTKEY